MADTFGNVSLAGKTGQSLGSLKVHNDGWQWRAARGGGKVLDVAYRDMKDVTYSKASDGIQLCVREKAGTMHKFNGLGREDLKIISNAYSDNANKQVTERPLVVSGHNWGEAVVTGSMMSFVPVGHTEAAGTTPYSFEVALADVSQVTQTKNKVLMEFHIDDTGSAAEKDTLVDISFYVPPTSQVYKAEGEGVTAAGVMRNLLAARADLGAGGEGGAAEALASFSDVAALVPRLKVDISLSHSMLHLQGANQDFRIKYSSVVRIFILPKPSPPLTVVVLSLDPPIRQGKTFYPHVLLQFPTEEEIDVQLEMDQETIDKKYQGKLQHSYEGRSAEVFCKVLKGLSGAKVTKPGGFQSSSKNKSLDIAGGPSKAVRCSFKAEDGYLFPLERSFFYIAKPPTLLAYEDVHEVEFQRQGGSLALSSAKTFDLKVTMKNEGEVVFRNIQRDEYPSLFDFIQSKGLRINNLQEQGPGGGLEGMGLSDDSEDEAGGGAGGIRKSGGERDPVTGEVYNESEDEDFKMDEDSDDGGEPTDESSEEGSDASKKDPSDSEAEEVVEKPVKVKKTVEKGTPKKRPAKSEEGGAAKKAKGADGKKAKRKKKDPNAPKRALSAFMFFSNVNRAKIKEENPEAGIAQIAKIFGEKWKSLTDEDKVQYEEMASQDKVRYAEAMKKYNSEKASAAAADAAQEASDEDEGAEEIENDSD